MRSVLEMDFNPFLTMARFSPKEGTISDGADGGKVGVIFPNGVRVALRALERHRQHERHAHAGIFAEGRAAVLSVRIDDRAGLRQSLLRAVVVGDDDIHPELRGPFHLGDRGNAVVHRDDQPHTLGGERVDGVQIEAVPSPRAPGCNTSRRPRPTPDRNKAAPWQ